MSRFAVLDDDDETSVLAKQGVIDETHKSALKDSILSGDDEQIQSARTLLDELAVSKHQQEEDKHSDPPPKESGLSTNAKPFVPAQPEKKNCIDSSWITGKWQKQFSQNSVGSLFFEQSAVGMQRRSLLH